jgi:hypothetical protein
MKTKQQVKKLIEKNNKIWEAASTRERRVLVCKDVLAQLKAKKYIAQAGQWVKSIAAPIGKDGCSLQEIIHQDELPVCSCCALGGLMLSTVKYANKVKLNLGDKRYTINYSVPLNDYMRHSPTSSETSVQLRKVFDARTLENIESVFELGDGLFGFDTCAPEEWYDLNAESRMVAIMENIIANDGVFNKKKLFQAYTN